MIKFSVFWIRLKAEIYFLHCSVKWKLSSPSVLTQNCFCHICNKSLQSKTAQISQKADITPHESTSAIEMQRQTLAKTCHSWCGGLWIRLLLLWYWNVSPRVDKSRPQPCHAKRGSLELVKTIILLAILTRSELEPELSSGQNLRAGRTFLLPAAVQREKVILRAAQQSLKFDFQNLRLSDTWRSMWRSLNSS